MKSLLLSTVFLASLATPGAAATITVDILDNGTLVATDTSSTGTVHLTDTTAPGFTSISVDAAGAPALPAADLTSTTLDVSAATTTIAHTLNIEIFQTGVISNGHTNSTFSVNNLIGAATIGPTVTTTYHGGTLSSLGATLASATFPVGTTVDRNGPNATAVSPFTSDAMNYVIPFAAHVGAQSANDTIELTTGVVPETSTWIMFGIGFGVMAAASAFRKRSLRFLEV